MAEALSTVSLISFIVSGICCVLAVFFWFKFRILKVIGDLSGRTARKSIRQMRTNNESSGRKSYRPSTTNAVRGRVTGSATDSERLTEKAKKSEFPPMPETGLLEDNRENKISMEQTALLADDAATELLTDEDEPTVFNQIDTRHKTVSQALTMIDEVILVHTDEVIE